MQPSFPQILNPQISASNYPPVAVGSDAPTSNPLQKQSPTASSVTDPAYFSESPTGTTSRKRPATRIKSTYPRKRAIQACQKCRIRRTKCDNNRPSCGSCVDLGVECNYSERDPSSYDAASLAILEKLTTIESLLRTDAPHSRRRPEPSSSDALIPSPTLSRVKSLNSPSLERTRDPIPCHMNIENVLSWPCFDDQRPNLDLKSLLNETNNANPELPPMIAELDQYPSEELLQRFMDNIFIFNPVLEEARVHQYIREARFHGLGWDAPSCLLLLIYAHGALAGVLEPRPPQDASDSRQDPSFKQAESFFSAAQRRLGPLLCRSGVIEAQCFFLAGVYLMATVRPLEAWKMFVQALACCQCFYSGKSLSHAENEQDRRLRESIYWTCFKSELELRLELAVSDTSVWDLTYPSFFPSPPEDFRSQREIVWYFYLAEIALRRMGNRILNYIYTTEKESASRPNADMIESIVGFELQAKDWIQTLPRGLGLDETLSKNGANEGASTDESDLHRTLKFILVGTLMDCYEMMYWPFITDAINNNSDSMSPQTRDFAQKALNICVDRINKNEPGFTYRHHGAWMMVRSCTRSALVLLAANRSGTTRPLLPPDWKAAVGKVVDMLRYWRRESRDVEDRLRLVEIMWRLA